MGLGPKCTEPSSVFLACFFRPAGSWLAYFRHVTVQVLPFRVSFPACHLPALPPHLSSHDVGHSGHQPGLRCPESCAAGPPLPRGWPVCRSCPAAHQARSLCQRPPSISTHHLGSSTPHLLEAEVTHFTEEKGEFPSGVLRTHSQHSWKA